MNGFRRLQEAAERNGSWSISGKDFVGKMMNVQELVSNRYDLLIAVTYCGYIVKSATLWDFSNGLVTNSLDGVAVQQLTAADSDKAGRIENVLLGNGRRF